MMVFCCMAGSHDPTTAVFQEAIDQMAWLDGSTEIEVSEGLDSKAAALARIHPELVIPVGPIEYVEAFCQEVGVMPVESMNIPEELRQPRFLRRLVWADRKQRDLEFLSREFGDLLVKPGKTPKRFEMTRYTGKEKFPEDEPLFVSQMLSHDILSEWRVFCLRGEIMDIRHYGPLDSWQMPDRERVKEMVRAVTLASCPSFALDVAVLDDGSTVAIEAHPFISCGLYGFDGPSVVRMAAAAWRHHVETPKRGML